MSVRDLIPWGRERTPSVRGGEVMDPFLSLQREMNRLFDDVFRGLEGRLPSVAFGGSGFGGTGFGGWPHTDVVETDKEYRVTAELPGLEDKDIDLTFQDGVLTLKGEKKVEHEGDGARYSERYHGRFQRSIAVGPDVDEGKVSASFKNGVLTVVLPKSPEVEGKVKRIPVNAK
ncbi:Hsp20/alpha crystallin family protein [Azospirillum rugosum]|uniref:HSP20 family protein n=1 Tax=Azospirillum rugosum TaxID=416170 RepID=A0ABS4SQW8_9PROT|nr:Hsp20/alpha crystallin family protein [Azospirillum rugosum]MBP2294352.1 HSP20 family protein [Azospirillum rugosum]MDQ0527687.1 HSP20 family protein [Azospirillum rugosum]